MKPIHHSSFILHPSPDPEDQMQETHSLTATLVMCVFLVLFWLLDQWAKIKTCRR